MVAMKINQATASPSSTPTAPRAMTPAMWRRDNPPPRAHPWTPADIPDLALFLWAKSPYCFVDDPPTVVATNGQAYAYQAPLFGTVNNGEQATVKPTFTSTGGQLDAAGVEFLSLNSPVVLDSDFTLYLTGVRATAGAQGGILLGSLAGQAALGFLYGDFEVLDDGSGGGSVAGLATLAGSLLVTGRKTAGFLIVQGTGTAESGGLGVGTMTFDQVGQAAGALAGNDDSSNRYRLQIVVKRYIALGSVEDLLIRAWISANDGAAI